MDITRRDLVATLLANDITELYHAHSVLAACHFIQEKALLSRGTVDRMGLPTTSQKSDKVDRTYSVWFDVFVDTDDYHHRIRKRNAYGPVLFVLDTAETLVSRSTLGAVSVTARNPWPTLSNGSGWRGVPRNKRWILATELLDKLEKGEFEQMVVFRHCGGVLPFEGSLREIVLDDPGFEKGDIQLYSAAYGALSHALRLAGLDVPIKRRVCRPGCECKAQYKKERPRTFEMFLSQP